jgi:hypothetical protein
MKYLFFPNNSTHILENHAEFETNISLEGYFYDRIESDDGRLVGVRFHLLENLSRHSVLKNFISDKRFSFTESKGSIDIVFLETDMQLLKMELLKINVTQDFGGASVVRNKNGVLGICFDLDVC